ncbi:MAG: ferritin-like domain-containing protein [Massilia sp.]
MTFNLFETSDQASAPRRIFLRNASLGAIAMAGMPAHAKSDSGQDVDIMQGALAVEHEGIAAYQLAGASGLLTPGTLKTALIFRGHHQQHRDSLEALITKAGGKPVKPKTDAEYTKALKLGTLKSEGDVVALAVRLEQGATNAYAGQIAALQDRKLAHLFGQLAADEAVHWTTLNNALGRPIQAKAYLFG